jgi:DNA-binding transcriptional ArsR family regulator
MGFPPAARPARVRRHQGALNSSRDGVDRQVSTCLTSGVVGDVFKAIADPTRRAILDELTDRDGQTLFELCSRLATRHGMGSTRQAISQHVDVLESAGLVRTRREGRYKFHHLDTAPLRQITDRWSITDREHD